MPKRCLSAISLGRWSRRTERGRSDLGQHPALGDQASAGPAAPTGAKVDLVAAAPRAACGMLSGVAEFLVLAKADGSDRTLVCSDQRLAAEHHGFAVIEFVIEPAKPMRPGNDAQRTIVGIRIIEMHADRNHVRENLCRRLDLPDSGLLRPANKARNVATFFDCNDIVLMPE